MKIFKNILYLSFIGLSIFLIGFFGSSYTALNNKNVEQTYFKDGFYKSNDSNNFISFGNFANAVLFVREEYYFIETIEYEENILTLKYDESSINVIVVDKDTLYTNKFNVYFYNAKI